MKVLSPFISAASGRIGDFIASHNRGGLYFKLYVVPTDPNTLEQQAVRAAMASAVTNWAALTDAQRADWAAYTLTFPRPKKLGRVSPSGAFPEYIRANVPRLHADNWLGTSLGPADSPPNVGTAPDPLTSTFLNDDATSALVVFPTDAPWFVQTGSALLVYVSPPKARTINYFRNPNTLAAAVEGTDP